MGEWIEVNLGDYVFGKRGVSYSPSDLREEKKTNTFFLLRSNNIQNSRLDLSDIQIVDGNCVKESQSLRRGDIVVCMSNGSKRLVGKNCLFDLDEEGFCVGAFCSSFSPNEKGDNNFVFYLFQSDRYQRLIDVSLAGSAINNLKNSTIEGLTFKIPKSKKEQSTIATVLSTVDKAIDQTEKLIAKYERIKTGLMQDLLTKGIDEQGNIRSESTHAFKDSPLGRIPVEWDVEEFGNQIAMIDSGWSPICEAQPAQLHEWGSLKTTSITWRAYNSNENKKLPDNLIPREQCEVKMDDILITRVGPVDRVGVVVHVNDPREKLMVSDNMLRLKIKANSSLLPEFIPILLGGYQVQKVWGDKKAGLAQAQVVLNQKTINSTIVFIPSYKEQKAIVDANVKINSYLDIEINRMKKLKETKIALMQDLLTGKVSVKAINTKEIADV